MTSEPLSIGAVVLVAAAHAGAPNHWAPFVLVGHSHRWTRRKLLAVTATAAAGHAIVTSLLGAAVALLGREVFAPAEAYWEVVAACILFVVGAAYVAAGLRGHVHGHASPVCEGGSADHTHPLIVLSLISMLSFSPCMAVAVAFLPAADLGVVVVLAVSYALVTVLSMTIIVAIASAAAERLRLGVLERHGQLITGVLLSLLGLSVVLVGCRKAEPPPVPGATAGVIRDDEALLVKARGSAIRERIALCDRIIREYPDSPSAPQAAFLLGQSHAALRDVESARAAYEMIVEKYRDPMILSIAVDFLWRYWEQKGDPAKAAAHLDEGVKLCRKRLEESPQGWSGADGIALGDYLVGLGRLDDACDVYRRVIDASSPSQDAGSSLSGLSAALRMGQARRRQGKKEDALAALEVAEALASKSTLPESERAQFVETVRRERDEIEK